jgi:hypothetical protein
MQIYNRYTKVGKKFISIFLITYSYICGESGLMIMDEILKKLRYCDQDHIAVLNAPNDIIKKLDKTLPGVQIDTEINARYLYDFMIIFTHDSNEVKRLGPTCIQNLSDDGKLWMVYPKGTSRKYSSDINRDHGWDPVLETGMRGVSQVSVDNDWSALRFRNARYIKSAKGSHG